MEEGSILLDFLSVSSPFPESCISKKQSTVSVFVSHFLDHQWMQSMMLSDPNKLLFQMQKKRISTGSKSMNRNDLRLSCRLMECFILFPRIYVFVFS